MTDLLHEVDAPSDAELISRVRGGDVAAYGELFSRHVDAARRLSRQLVRGPDADDLVSEAFAKVLTVLQGGGGPDVAFRAYLLTSVRRLHVDRIRSGARLQTSDDMEAFDPGVPFQDTAVAAFESGAAAKAFASLPERWQLVLWHLEVEGQKPADVAPLLGMSPNSVSALAYRAREGLRQAFLTMHLSDISETDCRWVNEHLGAYVRNGLAKRESTKVQGHLDECRRCTAMYLELTEVNSNLRAIIGPLLLGAAATGYLASSGTAAGGLGVMATFGRIRDTIAANAGAATVGAVAAGVAAIATAGIMLLPSSGPDEQVGADAPIGTVSTPGGPAGSATSKPDQDKETEPAASGTEEATPEAVLPSELPSPTAAPAVQVVQNATDQSTGAGTGTGEGSTSPSEPNSGGASPAEPSSTEPSPNEPSPTEPSPNEPSPTEPSPTEPSPTEPSPTPPTEPPAVTYTLQVNGSKIENGQVTFDLTGNPLPPTVYLQIESPPAGISFDSKGSSACVRLSDLVAQCTTAPPTSTVLEPLARAVSLAVSEPVQLTMPFSGAPEKDTEVTIALSAPLGNVLDRATVLYDVPDSVTTADVGLTLPADVTTDDVHEYAVTANVFGVPASYTGGATFTLTSAPSSGGPRALFVGDKTCAASADGQSLDCTSIRNGPLPLTIYVKDNSVDTTVAITMAPLDKLDDPALANNSQSTTLKARRPADVKLTLSPNFDGNSGKGSVTATITGAPTDQVVLTADYDTAGLAFGELPTGCSATGGVVTCTAQGPTPAPLTFEVELMDRPATFTTETISFAVSAPGYVETAPADNTGDVVLPRTKGSGSGTGSGTQLRATSTTTPSSAPDTAAGATTSATDTTFAVESATKKTNQLLHRSDRQAAQSPAQKAKDTKKAAAAAEKGAQGKATAAEKQAAAATKKATKPGAGPSDPGASAPPQADHGQDSGGQTGGGQTGGAQGSGDKGSGDKGSGGQGGPQDEPSPIAQVIAAVTELLP